MAMLTVSARSFDVDAALFDLDGTLVDTLGDFAKALNHTLADLALPPVDAAVIERFVGKGSEHLVDCTVKHVLAQAAVALPAIEIEAMCARAQPLYQRYYGEVNGRFARSYDGAHACISRLAAIGLPLACVTNKPTGYAIALLRQMDMLAPFAHVFGGDAFERKKPDPLPLLRACEALGTAPARTLMVGDSANDAQAARAAGCPVLLVTYGYNHGLPTRDVDADTWVDSLDALAITE